MNAAHLPTKHFDLADWQAIPAWEPMNEGECAPEGYSRCRDERGKSVVVYHAPYDFVCYAVRPIVRVKVGRRVEGKAA